MTNLFSEQGVEYKSLWSYNDFTENHRNSRHNLTRQIAKLKIIHLNHASLLNGLKFESIKTYNLRIEKLNVYNTFRKNERKEESFYEFLKILLLIMVLNCQKSMSFI